MDDIYSIAASGMAAQRTQMNLIAENLANAGLPRSDGTAFHARSAVFAPAGSFEQALSEAFSPAGDETSVNSLSASNPFDDEGFGRDMETVSLRDWGADADADVPEAGVSIAEATPPFSGVSVADVVDDPQPVQYTFDPGNPFAAKSGPRKGYVALPGVDPIQQMVEMMAAGRAYDANVSMLSAAKQMDIEAADIGRL
jgi:flagellar basal-body rod protein FlgC